MRRTAWVFGGVLLLAVVAAVAHGAFRRGGGPRAVARALVLGPPVVDVRAPRTGQVSSLGGIEVLVRFTDETRVLPETLRCLLNGHDVTDRLRVAGNGAGGAVFPLLEGENRLRVEVFASGWWTGGLAPARWLPRWYFEDAIEVPFEVHPPLYLDRG